MADAAILPPDSNRQPPTLKELAYFFLKLGTLAFGGPAAHIAMMEDEIVSRKAWLSRETFLDLLGAAYLIPGPSSTELAIYIGYRLAGFRGLLTAGICFILPAALIVLGISWAYIHYGSMPGVQGLLYGVQPVLIAILLQAFWRLGRTAVKTPILALIGVAAAVASLRNVNPLFVLVGAGVATCVARKGTSSKPENVLALFGLDTSRLTLAVSGGGAGTAAAIGMWPLFLAFLKVGCFVFGSGYVLLAFLREDLVTRQHWLTESQLLAAIAIGQVTPGPVFTTATFIGYLLGGVPGAVAATVGIFLPAFVLVALSGPLVHRMRQSPTAGAFLDGVNVASAALIAVVTIQLGQSAIVDPVTIIIAVISAGLLFGLKINATWVVGAGALAGLLLHK